MLVYSDSEVDSYFRLLSYGDYRLDGWNKAVSYDGRVFGYGMQNSTSALLSQTDVSKYTVSVELMGSQFLFPYYSELGSGGIVQQDDVTNYGDVTIPYEATFYDYIYQRDGLPAGSLSGEWASAESEYREFVYDNYLAVPSSTRTYLQQIIREEGFRLSDPNVINRIAEYVRNAAVYNKDYQYDIEDGDDFVVAFLRDYKEGVCRHFASAATLLYRTLGIPARYTIGYYVETKAGKTVGVCGSNAHAWTEVYIDGFGWVAVDSTPEDGMPDMEPLPEPDEKYDLIVESASLSKIYDGMPLTSKPDGGDVTYTGSLEAGHRIVVDFTGTLTDVGVVSNDFEVTVFDRSGKDVTYEYNIIKRCGTLTVLPRPITIETRSGSKPYDGTPLIVDSFPFIDLAETDWISYWITGSQTERGSSLNTVGPIAIWNKEGRDVTGNYSIELILGTLRVY